jgi:hypothetical protein
LGDIGKTKLYELIGRGKLRAGKLDGRTVIDDGSINELIDEILSAK